MHAICLSKYGSIDNLVQTELPKPQPKNRHVLVRAYASALGPADLKVALGTHAETVAVSFLEV
jgi:NADPH:quinone reductase-like Zn-dependent oxidoreductase